MIKLLLAVHYVSAAFSNNARQESCSLWLSLFPPPQISVGSNSGSLWSMISERAHWFEGLGKVMYGLTGEREREQRSEGSHVCMYVCICVAVDLEMQPPSWTLSRTSTHFLCWFWWCSAGPAPLSSFVHVLFRVQTSYGFIKLPKERKCVFLFRFSSANDQALQCQFYKVE